MCIEYDSPIHGTGTDSLKKGHNCMAGIRKGDLRKGSPKVLSTQQLQLEVLFRDRIVKSLPARAADTYSLRLLSTSSARPSPAAACDTAWLASSIRSPTLPRRPLSRQRSCWTTSRSVHLGARRWWHFKQLPNRSFKREDLYDEWNTSYFIIHWASKETYHFLRAMLTKIHSIKLNHIWTQISFNTS